MTHAEAVAAIKARFETQWADLDPAPDYAFDNEAFDPSASLDEGWARVSIPALPDGGQTLGGIGARRVTRRRLITIRVATPRDDGSAASAALVQHARSIFERVSWSDIHGEGATEKPGRNADAMWVVDLEIPVHFQETV